MSTLVQLRRLVRQRLGLPVSDDFFTDDVLTDLINLAIDTIEEEYRWPWMETVDAPTVASDGKVPLPVDYRTTRALFSDDNELLGVSSSDLLQFPVTYQSRPRQWAQVGDALLVRPRPDTTYVLTHLYYRATVPLVSDYDRPALPSRFAGVVVAKAAELSAQREDDRTAAAAHFADYLAGVTRMRRSLRINTKPVRIRVRPGGWI